MNDSNQSRSSDSRSKPGSKFGSIFGTIRSVVADTDQQCRLELDTKPGLDSKTVIVMITAMVIICMQEYWFQSGHVRYVADVLRFFGAQQWADDFDGWRLKSENYEIARLTYWAGSRVVTFIFVPMLVIKFVLREPIRDYGTRIRGIGSSLWVYGLMFAFMVPTVLIFSQTKSFQSKYPFYDLLPNETLGIRFWSWELLYCLQFVALEFFFRGFMVHGTKHRMGVYCILVMTFPYVMIHFGKPMPETFSAIGAGIILGFMSLKTCSIWMGAALHIAVAMSMDMLSLWHRELI